MKVNEKEKSVYAKEIQAEQNENMEKARLLILNPVAANEEKFMLGEKVRYDTEDHKIEPYSVQTLERKVFSTKVIELMEKGFLDSTKKTIRSEISSYSIYETIEEYQFSGYDDCDLEGKKKIREMEQQLNEVLEDRGKKYDKPGKIFLKLPRSDDKMAIEITRRELAKCGILYSEIGWVPLTRVERKETPVNSKAFARLAKEYEITAQETKGIKGFFNKVLDAVVGRDDEEFDD